MVQRTECISLWIYPHSMLNKYNVFIYLKKMYLLKKTLKMDATRSRKN